MIQTGCRDAPIYYRGVSDLRACDVSKQKTGLSLRRRSQSEGG